MHGEINKGFGGPNQGLYIIFGREVVPNDQQMYQICGGACSRRLVLVVYRCVIVYSVCYRVEGNIKRILYE